MLVFEARSFISVSVVAGSLGERVSVCVERSWYRCGCEVP
jgi:hypothetical protein